MMLHCLLHLWSVFGLKSLLYLFYDGAFGKSRLVPRGHGRLSMTKTRKIRKIIKGKPTLEGAGVHLKRIFGHSEVPLFDPFLLLDDFRNTEPRRYVKGFPWHPHRGIETITYVLQGDVEHADSMGNTGVITSGDMQWMTAGSGIIHQEMPKGDHRGVMEGFQLWANLPKSQKMIAPRYRSIKGTDVPEVVMKNGIKVKVISGTVEGEKGPVRDIIIDPEYLDVALPARAEFVHATHPGHTVFAYVIEGTGIFCNEKNPFAPSVENDGAANGERECSITDGTAVLFDDGGQVRIASQDERLRFLLISGKPINEPVAWYGPIVMNTEEELEIAFEEYRNGTFIKEKGKV
jgi:redox-sensitive bicupin YhaK (pirin superfamily)